MTSMFDLTGKVAVVTGGNSGIGLAMAEAMLRAGAAVRIWGSNEERNALARDRLASHADRVSVDRVDVGDPDAIDAGMERIVADHGRLDACFANAGVAPRYVPFVDKSPDEVAPVWRVNVDGVMATMRAAIRAMLPTGGGSLVATSSVASISGAPQAQEYAASKAAVDAIVRSIAVEYGRHGIRANALLPGWTVTPLAAESLARESAQRRILPRIPAGRWGQPEDFGGVAVYLASDASAYHTGDTLIVDGGYSKF